MDRLWTPWRYAYVTHSDPRARSGVPAELSDWPVSEDKGCVFCNMLAATEYAIAHGLAPEAADKATYIVHRGVHCFLCLNAFPYASGHAMVLPYQHADSLTAISPDAAHEMMDLAQRLETVLREEYRPDGINLGMNLGEAAGAGVASHIHLHILPRWFGDTNFMSTIAETRVLPETLDVTWAKLWNALRKK